jgi:hypothetical protein
MNLAQLTTRQSKDKKQKEQHFVSALPPVTFYDIYLIM